MGGRWQWAGHIALTAGAFALAVSITPLIQEAATLPEPWGRSLAVVALGIPPAAGWIVITLLGRISARIDRAASHRAAAVVSPQWSGLDGRPEVTVSASLFTMRALTALVVGTIIAGGVLAVALLIVAERWVLRLPPLMLVVVLGALVAVPLSAAVHVVVNRRRRPVTIRWRTGAVEIDTGERWTIPFSSGSAGAAASHAGRPGGLRAAAE